MDSYGPNEGEMLPVMNWFTSRQQKVIILLASMCVKIAFLTENVVAILMIALLTIKKEQDRGAAANQFPDDGAE